MTLKNVGINLFFKGKEEMKPVIIYIDMDGVLCDFFGAHSRDRKQNPDVQFPHSKLGFFENLEPLLGAIDAVNKLRENKNFDPWILTAPSTRNAHCYTEKRNWIENHFGYEFTKKLIISPNKALLKGAFLIDDYIEGKGQENFCGELIQFGSDTYPSWESVLKYLYIK